MKTHLIVLAIGMISIHASSFGQTQLGQSIESIGTNDDFGTAMALSGNGQRLAIGNARVNSDAGKVQVYELINNSWEQLGSDIDGSGADDYFGTSLSLSYDGSVIVIGAIQATELVNQPGYVRVLEYNGAAWVQVGSDVVGNAIGDIFGLSVDVSLDGTSIVVGATQDDETGTRPGYAATYQRIGDSWLQMGSNVVGDGANQEQGTHVSISAKGTCFATSARNLSNGYVRVFKWNNNGWIQKGNTIISNSIRDEFGSSISLNACGDIIAIGANGKFGSPGYVTVYGYEDGMWTIMGNVISGSSNDDSFGYSVDLSAKGDRLIVGALSGGPRGFIFAVGETKLYKLNGNTWTQIGSTIVGSNGGRSEGQAVSIASDGGRVASSGEIFASPLQDRGRVRAHSFPLTVEYPYNQNLSNLVIDNFQKYSAVNLLEFDDSEIEDTGILQLAGFEVTLADTIDVLLGGQLEISVGCTK